MFCHFHRPKWEFSHGKTLMDFVTISSNMVLDFFFFMMNTMFLFVRSYSARQPDSHDWPTGYRGQQWRHHTLPDSLSDLFPQRQAEHQPDGGGDCLAGQIPPGLLFTLSLATLPPGLLFTLSLATLVLGLLFTLSLTKLPPHQVTYLLSVHPSATLCS